MRTNEELALIPRICDYFETVLLALQVGLDAVKDVEATRLLQLVEAQGIFRRINLILQLLIKTFQVDVGELNDRLRCVRQHYHVH